MENQIPQEIKEGFDQVAKQYSESPATTDAGFILRLICRFVKPSMLYKMIAHKLGQ
jgi:hypothetical protein